MDYRTRQTALVKYLDHLSFPKVVGELVRNDSSFDGVTYSALRPKTKAEAPHISYRLISRVPGVDSLETRGGRPKAEYTNEDGSVTVVTTQAETCVFQWDVSAHTSEEADEILFRLERLIRDNQGLFQSMRAQHVLFQEQLLDDLVPNTNDLEMRSIRFLAVLQSVRLSNYSPINEVRIRTFLPQEEDYEAVVRGSGEFDYLTTRFISTLHAVCDDSPEGFARGESDYVEGLDYEILTDERTGAHAIRWLPPGKRPETGATYYLRFHHWTAFSTVAVPFRHLAALL